MWDGLFMLLTLSTIMAIASFLAGVLPLSFTLSPRQLRVMTFLGTGVLVGTSLIVIIPEGIETMYSAAGKAHSHGARAAEVTIPSVSSQQKGVQVPSEFSARGEPESGDSSFSRAGAVKPPVVDIVVKRTPEQPPKPPSSPAYKQDEKDIPGEHHQHLQKGGDDDSTEGHKEGHTRIHAPEAHAKEEEHPHVESGEGPDPHAYIGVSLILGFILMFLVDHLPEALSPSRPRYQSLHISLSNLSRGPHNSSAVSLNAMDAGSPPPMPPTPASMPPPKSSATTIGLIIHACADGIALGASSTAPSTSLSLVIFLAIMLHKAPAAFGLTSVLLKQGLSKRTARTHLIFFSLAAPAGALVTWAIVHALGRTRLGGDDGLVFTTGWILLFSGGTFLYVAMHSMNEATSSSHREDPTANGYIESQRGSEGLTKADIAIVMVGMLLPLVTQVGHAHAH
ncbi:ZIP zinc transporter-domain-containing protein [Massariosphaeria phaeospora]|uniref:ZIP zinc transporter-domain-containing protein n=1 Tax=Massariosphaeria phaeospora TaxID=100035 RepID=A0A7C8MJT5_9PLEO|nr:ZIP zinc transporter-domain-containing protein [Massariosphaeria phaeospora]